MSAVLTVTRAGPLASIQDLGRSGMLRHGISRSGPMDAGAFIQCGDWLGAAPGGIEITPAGIELRLDSGACRVGFGGGHFELRHNGQRLDWPGIATLAPGDALAVTPGRWGNFGYLRFNLALDVAPVLGSIATNSRAQLGGIAGRSLRAGDVLNLRGDAEPPGTPRTARGIEAGPIRVIWGLQADLFAPALRQRFVESEFTVSSRLDRMGVRLGDPAGVFVEAGILSLASDAIVPGDIQILGDGTPIVLMRDHQPTGGYPRIATVITADFDRFAQLQPASRVAFRPVTVEHAQALLRSRQS